MPIVKKNGKNGGEDISSWQYDWGWRYGASGASYWGNLYQQSQTTLWSQWNIRKYAIHNFHILVYMGFISQKGIDWKF